MKCFLTNDAQIILNRSAPKQLRCLEMGDLFAQLLAVLCRMLCLGEQALYARRKLAGGDRQLSRSLGQHAEITPRCSYGAQSADELDSQTLAYFLGRAKHKAADLTGCANVRSAAGIQIYAIDLDEANVALALGQFAQLPLSQQRLGFCARDGANRNGTILRDDFVGQQLNSFQTRVSDGRRVEVDGRALFAEMKGDRVRAEFA